MDGLALTLVSTGSWFLYCAVTNRAPIYTLLKIIQKPQDARQIVREKENRIDPYASDLPKPSAPITNPNVGLSWGGMTGLQVIPVSGEPTGKGTGAQIVAFARSQIGKPYKFGGDGSDGTWDCSGLVQKSLEQVGVSVPHSALAQLASPKGKIISGASVKNLDVLQVGDIIFPALLPQALGNHTAIYSGNGNIIEAPFAGVPVRERAIYPFLVAKRFVNG